MLHIILTESSEGCLEIGILLSARNRTLHQFPNPITYELSHIIDRMFWHSMRPQSKIDGGCQITQSIKQRTVQIKDIGMVHHRLLLVIMVLTLLLYLVAARRSSIVRCMRYFQRL